MDGMLAIGTILAAMALAVLLVLHMRKRYGTGNGGDALHGGDAHHGNGDGGCDGGGDGGGGGD